MLDFSKLKKGPVKCPTTQGNGAGNGFVSTEDKNAIQGEYGAVNGGTAKTAQNEPPKREPQPTDDDYLLQMGKIMQQNIRNGGRASWDIYHAMKRNAPPEELALIAVKGLALVLHEPLLFKTVAERFRQEYGITLTEKPPFEIIREK